MFLPTVGITDSVEFEGDGVRGVLGSPNFMGHGWTGWVACMDYSLSSACKTGGHQFSAFFFFFIQLVSVLEVIQAQLFLSVCLQSGVLYIPTLCLVLRCVHCFSPDAEFIISLPLKHLLASSHCMMTMTSAYAVPHRI